jgi:hypothetical protein
MDPFQKHGIEHLSASSINTFVAQPAFWAMRYLLGWKDEGNEKMWRGSAVEAGLDQILFGRTDEAVPSAIQAFEENAQGECSDPIEKERNNLPAFIEQAASAVGGLPKPDGRQLKFEYRAEGIEAPIIGYTDYEWETFGLDLKTTYRIPRQAVPTTHARQMGLYTVAKRKPFKLLYVSPKDAAMREFTQEELENHCKAIISIAHGIRRALSLSDDPVEVARIFYPDFDSFYWSSDEAKAEASKIWEI